MLRSHPFEEVLAAMDIAAEQYLEFKDPKKCTSESFNIAFNKIAGIIRIRKIERDNPELAKLKHCYNILKKRVFAPSATYNGMKFLQRAYDSGTSTDELMKLVVSVRTWTEFSDKIDEICG